jgi:GT2 family glycosyltransferase
LPASLSIVIPTHQRFDLLAACLASVKHFAPARTEILVIDDASPGGKASRLARSIPGVRTIRFCRRRGFCAAANAGVAAAQADFLQLLNDDTEVTAGWADAPLAAFEDPSIGAIAPLVLYWRADKSDHFRIDSAGDFYHRAGIAGKRGHGKKLTAQYSSSVPVFGASGSSAFCRREAFLRVGGFPESFGAYFEDVDLSFRLRRAGYRVLFEPLSRVYHHVGASHGRSDRRLLEQQSRNEERVYWRNLAAGALAWSLPMHAAVLFGKACRRWQEGTLAPFLCGRLRLLGEISDVMRHRRALAAAFGHAIPVRNAMPPASQRHEHSGRSSAFSSRPR